MEIPEPVKVGFLQDPSLIPKTPNPVELSVRLFKKQVFLQPCIQPAQYSNTNMIVSLGTYLHTWLQGQPQHQPGLASDHSANVFLPANMPPHADMVRAYRALGLPPPTQQEMAQVTVFRLDFLYRKIGRW